MSLRIQIVTPASRNTQHGNRRTAERWRHMLCRLGHQIQVTEGYSGEPCDLLIALHVRKSFQAIRRFSQQRPDAPLIVTLTGTDLYRDLQRDSRWEAGLELARRLILLQPDGIDYLPRRFRSKCRVVFQSAEPPPRPVRPVKRFYEVCVIGHLRAVKDPFRTAYAARLLPAESIVRVIHLGQAMTAGMQRRAEAEMKRNTRYQWLGELSPSQARHRLARSRLMVLTSRLEGGANVVSEALACGVPILSTRISGSIGILGSDYPGYFPVGDTRALARLLSKAELDQSWYGSLKDKCLQKQKLVLPEHELSNWRTVLDELELGPETGGKQDV